MRLLLKIERQGDKVQPNTTVSPDTIEGTLIAFNAAQESLAQQERALESYRGRAGTIMSAAAISASFLGVGALQHHRAHGWPIWIAIVAAATAIVLSIVTLTPLWGWRFHVSANQVLDDYVESAHPWTAHEIHRELAIYGELVWKSNKRRLVWLEWVIAVASLALAVEIVSWVVSLR